MKQLFLFVRPPRPLWPFNGPASSVWPPLAFATLAAALRESIPDLDVAILDAPAIQMGWRSLTAELHRLRPTYVGIGEEAVSCVEGLQLARLAKGLGAQVIAGGCFFSHIPNEAIGSGLIDAVVHGEGEITLVELGAVITLRRDEELVPGAWHFFRGRRSNRPFPATPAHSAPGSIAFSGIRLAARRLLRSWQPQSSRSCGYRVGPRLRRLVPVLRSLASDGAAPRKRSCTASQDQIA